MPSKVHLYSTNGTCITNRGYIVPPPNIWGCSKRSIVGRVKILCELEILCETYKYKDLRVEHDLLLNFIHSQVRVLLVAFKLNFSVAACFGNNRTSREGAGDMHPYCAREEVLDRFGMECGASHLRLPPSPFPISLPNYQNISARQITAFASRAKRAGKGTGILVSGVFDH